MKKLRLREAKICLRSHSRVSGRAGICEFFSLWYWLPFTIRRSYFISDLLYKCTLTYRFLHQPPLVFGAHMEPWGVQRCGQLPGQTRGNVRVETLAQQSELPRSRRGHEWVSALPHRLIPAGLIRAFQLPRESEICLGWPRPSCAGGAESEGFKFQFRHLPALWGQERSEFLCASVLSSVNPFTGFLWELNEMGHANT